MIRAVQAARSISLSVRRERPLRLGLSIGHPKGTCGTIGPFVRLPNGKRGFLSAASAVAPPGAKRGDFIHQPSPLDDVPLTGGTRAGPLVDFTVAVSDATMRADAGVVELLEQDEQVGNFAPAYLGGPDRPIGKKIAQPEEILGADVSSLTRSGLTHGRVAAVDIQNLAVQGFGKVLRYDGCMEVVAPNGAFSVAGDAGALVYRTQDMAPIGMIFASAQLSADEVPCTYVLPLGPALEFFGLSLL